MHIVYLANSAWPQIRGAERLHLSLCEHALLQGHDVTVLAPEISALHRACADLGVRSEAVEFSPMPWKAARLKATLRRLDPDIVHGMSVFPVALVRGLHLLPAGSRARYFAYVGIDPASPLPVATKRFQRLFLRVRNAISRWESPHLEAIFATSETVVTQLEAVGIRGRIIPIKGKIDVLRLEADSRLPLALPAGRPRIGYAAFLERLKGVDDLITAFAQLAENHPSSLLMIAGEGPDQDRLKSLADELGVGERTHFLGFIDPVAPFLAALDVYVSPSHSEALGRSIMEAMSLGIPCVATDVGGPSDVVRDGVSGLLVPPHDPVALAEAIGRLLNDPALARSFGETGRASAAAGPYTLSATLRTVFGEYDVAVARTRASDT